MLTERVLELFEEECLNLIPANDSREFLVIDSDILRDLKTFDEYWEWNINFSDGKCEEGDKPPSFESIPVSEVTTALDRLGLKYELKEVSHAEYRIDLLPNIRWN